MIMTRRILCGFPGNEETERTNRGHAIDYTMRYCEPEIGRSITSALKRTVKVRWITRYKKYTTGGRRIDLSWPRKLSWPSSFNPTKRRISGQLSGRFLRSAFLPPDPPDRSVNVNEVVSNKLLFRPLHIFIEPIISSFYLFPVTSFRVF